MCLRHYRKTPPKERETNRPLINPFWEIKPITKKEILAGITAPSKKKDKVEDALKSSFRELSKIYGGSLENELDYELLHDCNEIPDYLDNYIDYERFGRELMYDGFHEYSNGIIEIRR